MFSRKCDDPGKVKHLSPRRRGAAAFLLSVALISGCSSGGSAGKDNGPVTADEKAAQDQRNAQSARPPATRKDQFMPVLRASYTKVQWPKAYTMTTDGLWQKLGGDHNTIALSKSDADSMVAIWNICAWSLQLIDETKANRSAKDAVAALTALNNGDMQQAVTPILDDAKLGGLSSANQFIEANDCRKGFA
jgi:hypothetical protein